jgi:bifunctional non-homologous end joining protein LigD
MAKRKESVYHIHERSSDWLKIKANRRQEVVIGGFTKNEGSSKLFSSLLVGLYEGKKLIIPERSEQDSVQNCNKS